MSVLSKLRSGWRNVVHRSRVEHDLDEEVRTAFELLVEAKQRDGLTAGETRRLAAPAHRTAPLSSVTASGSARTAGETTYLAAR